MSSVDLSVQGLGAWLRLLAGLAVLLLPGLLAAQRVLPHHPGRWVLAPVFSLTILVLATFAGNLLLGIPVDTPAYLAYALLASLVLGWPFLRSWRSWRPPRFRRVEVDRALRLVGLAAVLVLVGLTHGLPHLATSPASGPVDAYVELAASGWNGLRGDDYPYPIHVDEHRDFARVAQMERQGEVELDSPYRDGPLEDDLLSVQGFRAERGFIVAVHAVHDVTDAPLGAIYRFLPALWGVYLAATFYALLRPTPGALVGAGFVALLPTTVRFLGPGLLISSPFALPWVPAAMLVAVNARGGGRFFAIMALVAGAFFLHLVIGTLTLLAVLGCILLRSEPWQDRVGALVASMVPLVWILPSVWGDVITAVSGTHTLPFAMRVLLRPGPILYGLAVAGAAVAFLWPTRDNVPHRVLAGMVLLTGASMYTSFLVGHRSDATFSRLLFVFFLGIAALAGLGVGHLAKAVDRNVRSRLRGGLRTAAPLAVTVAALVAAMALATPLQHNLAEPYYRVHNEQTWLQVEAFAEIAEPGQRFLVHPWQAPIFAAATGAYPHAVLHPGSPPVNDADYRHYLSTGGDAAWFSEREIDFVVGPVEPGAPHDVVGPSIYRLRL